MKDALIDRVTISPVSDLNALNVLRPNRMLVTKAALEAMKERAKISKAIADTD